MLKFAELKNKKRLILTFSVSVLLIICAVFGIIAYLTNADSVSNIFTVGDVKIELSETNFSQPDEALVANQTIQKNPVITNTGKSDAVVFLKITVPVRNVKTVNENRNSVSEKTPQEVYTFKSGENNGFNNNWTQISKTEGEEKNIYVFGYNTRLSKGNKTDALFDSVTYINVLEGEIPQGDNLDIQIDAYGVQADNISVDTSTLDSDKLSQIYNNYIVKS